MTEPLLDLPWGPTEVPGTNVMIETSVTPAETAEPPEAR